MNEPISNKRMKKLIPNNLIFFFGSFFHLWKKEICLFHLGKGLDIHARPRFASPATIPTIIKIIIRETPMVIMRSVGSNDSTSTASI